MPGTITTVQGVIETIFAHRFVLKRHDGTRLLADLGPEGAERYRLIEGVSLTLEGEAKPSEIKVMRLLPQGGEPITIARGRKDDVADPAAAMAAVAGAGFETVGEPCRKPKHFEVLARRGGDLVELHVKLDGTIGRETPADAEKWAATLRDC